MKYKVINNIKKAIHTRAEYLYNEFCLNQTLTLEIFIERVKTTYYKFNALFPGKDSTFTAVLTKK
mgnify:CR=1 FL=1